MRLLTVGHGTLQGAGLIALLGDAGLAQVVDVRRFPGSRRHPQFGRDALAKALEGAGIGYRWDEALGGRRSVVPGSPNVALRNAAFRGYADHMATEEFRAALARLIAQGAQLPTTVLCAESLWWRCHRRLLADAAVLLHGAEVFHLGHDGRLTVHVPTDGVRVSDDRLVYDAGETPPLV